MGRDTACPGPSAELSSETSEGRTRGTWASCRPAPRGLTRARGVAVRRQVTATDSWRQRHAWPPGRRSHRRPENPGHAARAGLLPAARKQPLMQRHGLKSAERQHRASSAAGAGDRLPRAPLGIVELGRRRGCWPGRAGGTRNAGLTTACHLDSNYAGRGLICPGAASRSAPKRFGLSVLCTTK